MRTRSSWPRRPASLARELLAFPREKDRRVMEVPVDPQATWFLTSAGQCRFIKRKTDEQQDSERGWASVEFSFVYLWLGDTAYQIDRPEIVHEPVSTCGVSG